ncbi:MAG: nonstructural protein [Arizlama microvirus]|nr:MAG: nonstructural protein [Arizlama microvirus]
MKMSMFTVYDSKAEIYLQPFFLQSRGEALRSWDDVVNDAKSQFNKHPTDFTLFEIGTYDTNKATFDVYQAKISLGSANEFKKQ